MEEILLLRRKIDEVDSQILQLLNDRLDISKRIGTIKKKLKIPIGDPQREDEVYRHIIQKASKPGMDTSKIKEIYHEIIAMCIDTQEDIAAPQA